MNSRSNQRSANAGRDIAGRDIVHNSVALNPTVIEKLLTLLKSQIENDEQIQETIDDLSRYFKPRATDGIVGLEAKIAKANLNVDLDGALEKKEMFVKLLDKYSMYSTAQQIFVHFLARTENEFNGTIYPSIPMKTEAEINCEVMERIVKPLVEECGVEVFILNDNIVMGMIYWLAEQCFIKWHQ